MYRLASRQAGHPGILRVMLLFRVVIRVCPARFSRWLQHVPLLQQACSGRLRRGHDTLRIRHQLIQVPTVLVKV